MYKIDLHTHSLASPDGSLTLADYRRMIDSRALDYIAVTDHNTIAFALEAKAALGERIIVGEEITTAQGEVIGLYLREAIEPGLRLQETIRLITDQGGIVYMPHPFETIRKGVSREVLDSVAGSVQLIEAYNGRALLQNRSRDSEAWAREHQTPGVAASDSHGRHGWGRTYTAVDRTPSAATLVQIVSAARLVYRSPGLRAVLYPKFNRMRRELRLL